MVFAHVGKEIISCHPYDQCTSCVRRPATITAAMCCAKIICHGGATATRKPASVNTHKTEHKNAYIIMRTHAHHPHTSTVCLIQTGGGQYGQYCMGQR